jgi:hypothetical protein
MSLHNGSGTLAHNLDRFDIHSDFELVAAEAARLGVEPEAVRRYRDVYGDEPAVVRIKGMALRMPAYEAHIRRWVLGERIRFVNKIAPAN